MVFASLLLVSAPQAVDCRYDREHLIAMDQRSFDQDLTGGWRALAAKGCDREAADLVRDWRVAHKAEDGILYWHEGQLRADAGDYAAAAPLFEKSRKPGTNGYDRAWNLYVDGSIAFVRGDRAGLEAVRAKLAAVPRPADFQEEARGPDGKPILLPDGTPWRVQWPLNLDVLDGLLGCWGKPYAEAYGCRAPSAS
ncbi:MAG: hypothetical protein J7495_06660 [Sphingomonas sp.]|nr:hypothetical protein [Sphingomonas sp.]